MEWLLWLLWLAGGAVVVAGVVWWWRRPCKPAEPSPRETLEQRYEHANRIADAQIADGYRDNYRRIGGHR